MMKLVHLETAESIAIVTNEDDKTTFTMRKVGGPEVLTNIGVTQVTIPLPFRLNHVNCFLAEGARGWTIIDAGLNTKVSRDSWQPIIAKHGVKDIILTHYHPDHFGYAGTLQQLTDAEVWMTKVDAVQWPNLLGTPLLRGGR